MWGERARVADRVRELLGAPAEEPAERWRWNPGRRGAAAVGVAAVVTVLVTVWWVLTSRPPSVPVSSTVSGSTAAPAVASVAPSTAIPSGGASAPFVPATPVGSSTAPSPGLLVVDVAGKVVRPGLYKLPPGSRVYDAIEAAGGARAGVDLVALNLAAPLQDGQQVVVGRAGVPAAGAVTATELPGGAASAARGPVDLNTATLEQLDTLPGVGPVLAQHILDWRTEHGQFTSVDQLNDVSGIGDVKYAELHGLVTV